MLVRKSKQEPVEFGLLASYPDAAHLGLELLVDEAREKKAGRSLLDAFEVCSLPAIFYSARQPK